MGVEASWLTARVAADDLARQPTVSTLLPQLTEYLRPGHDAVIRIIDLGAGSGANQRWLAPRLPFRQRWVHLDHDPAILTHTHGAGRTELVVGGIDTLIDLLEHESVRPERPSTVITCAAVLDVLTRADLVVLCDLLAHKAVPALLSLSVTGEMSVEPSDADDDVLLEAFNAHQRRHGRAGPDAPGLVVERCRETGIAVDDVATPWILDESSDPLFVMRFLRERVDAALAQDPTLRGVAANWLEHRLAEVTDSRCRINIGHRDLLILP